MAAPFAAYLVAGHEYSRKGIAWTRPCLHREKKLASRSRFRPLEVTTFDVSKGEVRIARFGLRTPPDKPEVEIKKLKEPISEKNYVKVDWGNDEHGYVFASGFSSVLSIVDIYEYMEKNIKAAPGRIVEFSIFSHAYYDGPILVNTYPNSRIVNLRGRNILVSENRSDFNVRQKADLDPRMIDFASMPQDRQKLWQAAFCAEGRSWIWGCNDFAELLSLLRFLKHGKPRLTKSTSNSTKIRKRLKRHEIDAIRNVLKLPLMHTKGTADVYELDVADARAAITEKISNTYANSLARASNRIVCAAAPGTYSVFVDKKTQTQMWVSDDTADVLGIYGEIFNCKQDDEGWRYVMYSPDGHHV